MKLKTVNVRDSVQFISAADVTLIAQGEDDLELDRDLRCVRATPAPFRKRRVLLIPLENVKSMSLPTVEDLDAIAKAREAILERKTAPAKPKPAPGQRSVLGAIKFEKDEVTGQITEKNV